MTGISRASIPSFLQLLTGFLFFKQVLWNLYLQWDQLIKYQQGTSEKFSRKLEAIISIKFTLQIGRVSVKVSHLHKTPHHELDANRAIHPTKAKQFVLFVARLTNHFYKHQSPFRKTNV